VEQASHRGLLTFIDPDGIDSLILKKKKKPVLTSLLSIFQDLKDEELHVNIIGFVLMGSATLTPHDMKIFQEITEFLAAEEYKEHAILIITHAEERTYEQRQRYIEGLKENETTRELLEYCRLGHVFVGAPLSFSYLNTSQLRPKIDQNIRTMRQHFLEKLLSLPSEPAFNSRIVFREAWYEVASWWSWFLHLPCRMFTFLFEDVIYAVCCCVDVSTLFRRAPSRKGAVLRALAQLPKDRQVEV